MKTFKDEWAKVDRVSADGLAISSITETGCSTGRGRRAAYLSAALILLALALAPWTAWAQSGARLDLAASSGAWGVNVGGACVIEKVSASQGFAFSVTTDGGQEDFPSASRSVGGADWRAYSRLQMRLRVATSTAGVFSKRLALVFYDRNLTWRNRDGQPQKQQVIYLEVPVNQWQEIDLGLGALRRSQMDWVTILPYELAPGQPHVFTCEVESMELVAAGSGEVTFDGEVADASAFEATAATQAQGLATSDGLGLRLGSQGRIAGLTLGASAVGEASVAAGLMVRDAVAGGAPVMATGALTRQGDALNLQAQALDLDVSATFRSEGEWLEVQGEVSDLRGEDRAVTVYFALPLTGDDWTWQGEINPVPELAESGTPAEQSAQDPGMQVGLSGGMGRYPLAAVASEQVGAGLALAVRMDEPVVHRIVWNPQLKLFFVAMDFGLVSEINVHGRSLATAPFRVLFFRTGARDPLRGALQRYYDFYPQFFAQTLNTDGGWHVWGTIKDDDGALAAGLRLDWGPYSSASALWDNLNHVLALAYVEPVFYQQTMGDLTQTPSPAQTVDRMQRSGAGEPAILGAWENLAYVANGCGHTTSEGMAQWLATSTRTDYMQAICSAADLSAMHDAQGRVVCDTGWYGWIGNSNQGGMIPCNLDPDLPQGKGAFNLDTALDLTEQGYQAGGATINGVGLDSFTAAGWRADYRRAHFKYADFPLTFSTLERRPVVASFASAVEWLREASGVYHARGMALMANVGPGESGWLQFAAPYLDVMGAESAAIREPEQLRAIMRDKTLTDLPGSSRLPWEVDWHLLYGAFPGWGNVNVLMAQAAALRERLMISGWQPETGVQVSLDTVLVERYGGRPGQLVYLCFHNTSGQTVSFTATVDVEGLGLEPLAQMETVFTRGGSLTPAAQAGQLAGSLPALGTLCVRIPSALEPQTGALSAWTIYH